MKRWENEKNEANEKEETEESDEKDENDGEVQKGVRDAQAART